MKSPKEFNHKDWPDDGTDWDGVHDEVMVQILKNLEDAKKLRNLPSGKKMMYLIELEVRLKKRIEDLKKETDWSNESYYNQFMQELQKILERKK